MRKKITYLYSAIFVTIFVFLFSVNFVYKNYVIDLKVGNKYKITAYQYFEFKSLMLTKLFDKIFLTEENKDNLIRGKIYKIKKKKIENSSLSIKVAKSYLSFDLITRDFYNKKDLEEKINSVYLGSLKEVVNDLEKNAHLFNYYNEVEKERDQAEEKINLSYDRLINSEFFTKYPPKRKCVYDTKELCLNLYSNFYKSIDAELKSEDLTSNFLKKYLGNENSDIIIFFEIIKDFNENRFLYDYPFMSFEDKNLNSEILYLEEKYKNLINSEFFIKYLPQDYCLNYSLKCFKDISKYFNQILMKHKREILLPFNVEVVEQKKKFNFLIETPIILGISIFFTYILFNLTNKSFKRKIK